jgi:hypothetical protein
VHLDGHRLQGVIVNIDFRKVPEHFVNRFPEYVGKLKRQLQGRLVLAPFYRIDRLAAHAHALCELLLRHPAFALPVAEISNDVCENHSDSFDCQLVAAPIRRPVKQL